jgi:ankyrin repeat protein
MDAQPEDDEIIGGASVAGVLARASGGGAFGRVLGFGMAALGGSQAALWRAAWVCDAEAARAALDAGAAAYARGPTGWSVLHRACVEGGAQVVALLLASGASPKVRDSEARAPIHVAAGAGHADVLDVLLRDGGTFADCSDGRGRTAMHWAARAASLACVRVLAEAGAEVDLRDSEGMSPLHYAAAVSSVPVAQELVSRGASLANLNTNGETPLVVARRRGNGDPALLTILTPPTEPEPSIASPPPSH